MGLDLENPQDQRCEEPQPLSGPLDLGNTVSHNSVHENSLSQPFEASPPEGGPRTNMEAERYNSIAEYSHINFFKVDVQALRSGYTASFLMTMRCKLLQYFFFMAFFQALFYVFRILLLRGRLVKPFYYAERDWLGLLLQSLFLM